MDMRDGMLGVVIVAIALVASLAVAYFAGVTAEEYEVTKYNYLAPVDGLFDMEQSPQYIEFDPSSNYTGYYNEPTTNPYLHGHYYFAEDDVGYTPYVDSKGDPRVNNYKVDLEPEAYQERDYTLTDGIDSTFYATDGKMIIYYGYDPDYGGNINDDTVKGSYLHIAATQPTEGGTIDFTTTNIRVCYLTDLLKYYNITEPGEYLFKSQKSSGEMRDMAPLNPFDPDWVMFSFEDQWVFDDSLFLNDYWILKLATQEFNKANETKYDTTPTMSCKVILKGVSTVDGNTKYDGIVYLYSDTNMYSMSGTNSIEKTVVAFGNNYYDSWNAMNLSNALKGIYQILRVSYLDPNYGVYMKDEE